MYKKIEISHKTVIFTVFFLISLWFLYFIKDVILIFFVAVLVMIILNPTVTKLSKWKIPRSLSVGLVYLLLLTIMTIVVAGIIPPLIEQTTSFANSLPGYLSKIKIFSFFGDKVIEQLVSQLGSVPGEVVKVGVSVLSNVISVITILIFAFYLLIAREKLDEQIASYFGEEKKEMVKKIIDRLETRLGGWARGQLTLMFMIGVLSFIGYLVLGIPYALPLAILAGIFEIVPNIGPIISGFPAVIIGLGISPITGLATIALAFLVHQLENYLFVPKVMEKSVGVNPVATLLALAIGFKVAGIVGIVISVPVFIIIQTLLKMQFSESETKTS